MNTLQRIQLADQQVSLYFKHSRFIHLTGISIRLRYQPLESCIFYKSPYPKKCVIIVPIFIMSLLLQKYKMYSRHLK